MERHSVMIEEAAASFEVEEKKLSSRENDKYEYKISMARSSCQFSFIHLFSFPAFTVGLQLHSR